METKLNGAIANMATAQGELSTAQTDIANVVETVTTLVTSPPMATLGKLHNSKLQVRIISYKGFALDNYFGKHNEGDGARTVQFQTNDSANTALNMTLEII